MNKRRTFTAEFKAKAVLAILSGAKSTAEVCREHQVKESVVARWKHQFLERASKVFEKGRPDDTAQARIAELEQMVGKQAMELEIAKKASLYLGRTERRNRL